MNDQVLGYEYTKIQLERMLKGVSRLHELTISEIGQERTTQLELFTANDETMFSFQVLLSKDVIDEDELNALMSLVNFYLDHE